MDYGRIFSCTLERSEKKEIPYVQVGELVIRVDDVTKNLHSLAALDENDCAKPAHVRVHAQDL